MGQDRQAVLAGQCGDPFEQLGRAPLGRGRGKRPCLKHGRGLSQPPDLAGHKVEFVAGAAVLSSEALLDRLWKILCNEWRNVECTSIPCGERKNDADAGLLV